jgi:hypothetical protein
VTPGSQNLRPNVVHTAAGDKVEDIDIDNLFECKHVSFRRVNVCKSKRKRTEQVYARICKQILDDPENFDLEALKMPNFITSHELLSVKMGIDLRGYHEEIRKLTREEKDRSHKVSL